MLLAVKTEDAEVLVTGAAGLIGRWLLAALTAKGRNVVALVRRAQAREIELRAFVDKLGGDSSRLAVVSGDVEVSSLGLKHRFDIVRDVYHLAARFEFGLAADAARRANVDGTLRVLEWALALPTLRRFVYLGGYRITRPPLGLAGLEYPFSEDAAKRLYRKHGAYEASKHESFAAFRRFVGEHQMPWTVVHPSTVIGDSRTGETTQLVGLAQTIERLWQGRLPALVGTERTFVPVVSVDYLASVLASIPENDTTLGQELTVLDSNTPPLPELVRAIAAHLDVRAPRHVLPVGLVRALPEALTGVEKETLGFLSEDRYDTASTEAHAEVAGLTLPNLERSLVRWCDQMVSTRFGRDPSADRGKLLDGVFSVGDPTAADFVYLHGIPWNGDAWKPVDDRVGGGARLDLPGLGRSAPSSLDEVAWLERALGGRKEKVVLVGHSLGAGMAVRYAHARPEQVRRLVLVAPAFLQRPASRLMRLTPIVARILRRSTTAELAARLAPELEASAAEMDAIVSAVLDLQRRGVAKKVAGALARAGRPAVRAALQRQLAELRCPVTIVHGDTDPLTVVHPLALAEVCSVPGAGHAVHVTRADAVATIVRASSFRLVNGRSLASCR